MNTYFVTTKGYCEIISKKRAETLILIIVHVVRDGSIIHTDVSFDHRKIIHNYNFFLS
ncbi:hypothetical protein MXB_5485 [Myxobolus squamalis]|nr:hypothetical protein MXB_5485 [Myxobolus squamalis]